MLILMFLSLLILFIRHGDRVRWMIMIRSIRFLMLNMRRLPMRLVGIVLVSLILRIRMGRLMFLLKLRIFRLL